MHDTIPMATVILTKGEQSLLEWLADEDYSSYGECWGGNLDELRRQGLAEVAYTDSRHQDKFNAGVRLTGRGWEVLEGLRHFGLYDWERNAARWAR